METISQVRETLTRSLENAKEQLKASREAKHQEHEAYAKIASVFLPAAQQAAGLQAAFHHLHLHQQSSKS